MNEEVYNALNTQANHEIFAAHSYEAMAYWCDDNDFLGFARFFMQQAVEERDHAKKFLQHLLDRSKQPKITAIEEPKNDFENLLEAALHARMLERLNTEKIKECYKVSIRAEDYESQPMLLEFITEQVEELSWTDTMVTLTERAQCSGATYNLDRHIISDLTKATEAP